MGLSADAFYQVISQVGNYSDIFDRHLTPLGITREGSANAQWTDGGLIYAPPALIRQLTDHIWTSPGALVRHRT